MVLRVREQSARKCSRPLFMSETWNKPGCILSHFREERFDIDLSCSSPSEKGWGSNCWRSHWSLCLSRRARSWLCLHRSVLPPETALADSNPWTILAARSFPSRSVTKTETIIGSIDGVSKPITCVRLLWPRVEKSAMLFRENPSN